jgi:P-type Cu+ transporter
LQFVVPATFYMTFITKIELFNSINKKNCYNFVVQ